MALEDARLLAENERLADAARRTAEFIADVAHELRTPLASIKAYSEVLLDQLAEDDTGSLERFLIVINAEADRLAEMLADLLDLAGIETGRIVSHSEPVDISGVAAEAADAARGRGASINLVGTAPPILGDLELTRRLVQSVIGAAVVLSPEDAAVRVELAEAHGRAVLTVSDKGSGIGPEDIPHVLDKFYRGRAGSPIRKLGLRLPLARAIAELQAGELRIESVPDQGSTYTLSLPALAR